MIICKRFWILCLALIILSVFLRSDLVLSAADCESAEQLFQKSITATDSGEKRSLLESAVNICPTHAFAWNNLGLIYENEGQLDKAEQAYRHAAEYRPDLGAPFAGLGDVAMTQGRFQEAARWYKRFLAILTQQVDRGDPQGLGPYEEEYRAKYEQAKLRFQIHQDSMSSVVPEASLTRGMRSITVRPRPVSQAGISVAQSPIKPTGPEQLALCILFDFDSAELRSVGREQLMEMARAMLSSEFRANRFMIEGHTDTHGTYEYNLELSRRRADTVRAFLTRQGVNLNRLEARGYGESKPIISSGSINAQKMNRRVVFVRIGPG